MKFFIFLWILVFFVVVIWFYYVIFVVERVYCWIRVNNGGKGDYVGLEVKRNVI